MVNGMYRSERGVVQLSRGGRYAETMLTGSLKQEGGKTNGFEKSVHEFIHAVRLHEGLAFQHTHDKPGNDGQMFLKSLLYDLASFVVVVHSLDLGYATKCVESLEIHVVNVRHVRICDDHIRKRLHVTKSVCDPALPRQSPYSDTETSNKRCTWSVVLFEHSLQS